MQTLLQLVGTTLYRSKNVKINDTWLKLLEQEEEDESLMKTTSSDSDEESDSDNVYTLETLIHGFTNSRSIQNMQEKIIEIAPAQESYPIGIFRDKHVEEMNFPTLFFAEPWNSHILEQLSY